MNAARAAMFASLSAMALAAACGSFESAEPNATAPANDGGPAVPDAAPGDAANDVGASDAGSTDAAPDAELRWCLRQAKKPKFCADFDEGAITDGWTDRESMNAGMGLLSKRLTNDPSLQVDIPAVNGVDTKDYLYWTLGAPAATTTLKFTMRAESIGASDVIEVVQLYEIASPYRAVGIRIDRGALKLYADSESVASSSPLGNAPTAGRVTFVLMITSTGVVATREDDTQNARIDYDAGISNFTGVVRLGVGLVYTKSATLGGRIVFDDILVE